MLILNVEYIYFKLWELSINYEQKLLGIPY